MFEGRPQAAVAGAVRDVLWSAKTKQREVGWGQGGAVKKKGEAGMGRLVSHGPALYREERGKGRYEKQGVRTLLDFVLHRVPQ